MKTPHGQRMQELLNLLYLNPTSLSKSLGIIGNTRIRNILTGHNGISNNLADLICKRYPQVSKPWLMHGIGQPFIVDVQIEIEKTEKHDKEQSLQEKLLDVYDRALRYQDQLRQKDETIATLQKLIDNLEKNTK